jgi:hypothetical protein
VSVGAPGVENLLSNLLVEIAVQRRQLATAVLADMTISNRVWHLPVYRGLYIGSYASRNEE